MLSVVLAIMVKLLILKVCFALWPRAASCSSPFERKHGKDLLTRRVNASSL